MPSPTATWMSCNRPAVPLPLLSLPPTLPSFVSRTPPSQGCICRVEQLTVRSVATRTVLSEETTRMRKQALLANKGSNANAVNKRIKGETRQAKKPTKTTKPKKQKQNNTKSRETWRALSAPRSPTQAKGNHQHTTNEQSFNERQKHSNTYSSRQEEARTHSQRDDLNDTVKLHLRTTRANQNISPDFTSPQTLTNQTSRYRRWRGRAGWLTTPAQRGSASAGESGVALRA